MITATRTETNLADRRVKTLFRAPALDGTGAAEGRTGDTETYEAYVEVSTSHNKDSKKYSGYVVVNHHRTEQDGPFTVSLCSPMDCVYLDRIPVARHNKAALLNAHDAALLQVERIVDNLGDYNFTGDRFDMLAALV
jgi:hypothetical protein